MKELERLDIEVGKKNNLGEIKSFVLLQVLSVMLGEQIYVFCSDDKMLGMELQILKMFGVSAWYRCSPV